MCSRPLTVVAIVESDLSGKIKESFFTIVLDSPGVPEEAEQREGDERQRHEREQRVVGDHRRQVRAPVRVELEDLKKIPPETWHRAMLGSAADGRDAGAQGADGDLVPDRGCVPVRREGQAGCLDASGRRGDDALRRCRAGTSRRGREPSVRPGRRPARPLEAATLEGSVFVVLDGDSPAAATRPEPTVGLVFYDLRSCLRAAHPGRRRRQAAAEAEKRGTRAR